MSERGSTAIDLWVQAQERFRRRDYAATAELLARLVGEHHGGEVDMAQVRLLRGVALLRLGRPAEGVPELRLAVELDPANARAHQKLGAGVARLGLDEEALPHLERSAAMAPDNAEYQWRVGEQYRRLGRRTEAKAAFERSLALDPRFDRANEGLAALVRPKGSWLTLLVRTLKPRRRG